MKVLLLANQTLASRRVFERVVWLRDEHGTIDLHIVVPLSPSEEAPSVDHDLYGRPVIDYLAIDAATARLRAARSSIAQLENVTVTGEIGNPDPLRALRNALREDTFTHIILATLPTSVSRWLKLDLVHRARRAAEGITVDHVIGDEEMATPRSVPRTWHELGVRSDDGALRILMIDDNEADLELTNVALDRAPIDISTRIAGDGQEALMMLAEERPDLVLLDLSMPGLSGFETLKVITGDPQLAEIPVVILTTSDRDADRERAHELGAAAYVVKENDFGRFEAVLQGVLAEVATI